MSTQPSDKAILDVLLARRWVELEVVKARDLNLPAFHIGYEMFVQAIPLMAAGCTIEQSRVIVAAFMEDWLAKWKAAVEAAKPGAAMQTADQGNVVSLRPPANDDASGD
jgi:hypothetical protein